MAIKKDGTWHGVTGNISFYKRNGIEVMRLTPKTKKTISPAFAEAQRHFAFVLNLVKKFKPVVDIGYKDFELPKYPYNIAMSRNLNKYKFARRDNKTENLSWFEFSKGELSNAASFEATLDSDNKFTITWSGTDEWTAHHDDDNLIAVIYNKTKDLAQICADGIIRKAGKSEILLKDTVKGDVLEVFVMFHVHQYKYKAASKENVSDSKWLGQYTV
ncbi:MAG TPA: DUF6266 family protein [Lentimicrobium sp.]|nr:DUF6266 family protein [Lentimicrobium sp.]